MIYKEIMRYWTHACGKNLKVIPFDQTCENCGINHAVESLRFLGHKPKVAELSGKKSRFSIFGKNTKKK